MAAVSVTVFEFNRKPTIPSDAHVTLTFTVTFAVLEAGVAVHPVAVPVNEKSLAAIPLTDSENVNV